MLFFLVVAGEAATANLQSGRLRTVSEEMGQETTEWKFGALYNDIRLGKRQFSDEDKQL